MTSFWLKINNSYNQVLTRFYLINKINQDFFFFFYIRQNFKPESARFQVNLRIGFKTIVSRCNLNFFIRCSFTLQPLMFFFFTSTIDLPLSILRPISSIVIMHGFKIRCRGVDSKPGWLRG